MRRVYIYSLLLFAICFAGCEHKLDSYPPHLYRYYLAFIDKSGNDLLADVPFEINSERDSVLLRGTYTFEFIKSTEDDYFDTKSLILGKVSGYALMSAWKTGMGIRSRKSLLINLPVSIYSVMRKYIRLFLIGSLILIIGRQNLSVLQ